MNGTARGKGEKERTHGGQRKVGITDHRQRTCILVLQPHEEHGIECIHGGDTPSVETRRTRGHHTDPDDVVRWRKGDSLVDVPVGHGQELVVWEGILLVAMIGMLERLLDQNCSFGPNIRRLCEKNVG